jgi:hypothetical protein
MMRAIRTYTVNRVPRRHPHPEISMRIAMLAVAMMFLLVAEAPAQIAADLTNPGVLPSQQLPPALADVQLSSTAVTLEGTGLPGWLKWGAVGGVGAALLVGAMHGAGGGTPRQSRGEAMLVGGVGGFVIIGGSVAVYQSVCSPGSWSQRNHLCGRRR